MAEGTTQAALQGTIPEGGPFFWRIALVGFATSVFAGVSFAVVESFEIRQTVRFDPFVLLLNALFFGGIFLLIAWFAWLPLTVVWNVIVFWAKARVGFVPAAVRTSVGMALALCLLPLGLIWDWDAMSFWQALLVGLWVLSIVSLAGYLTLIAFRRPFGMRPMFTPKPTPAQNQNSAQSGDAQ